MKEIYILAAVRTPIGSFGGSLSSVPAPKLGAIAIKGAMEKINLSSEEVDEVIMGNVLQAGLGQAPARQASMFAGISNEVPATTVNKVCASGMKALSLATQSILAGDNDLVIAGGMENMSMVPHYMNARNGQKLGNITMKDGLVLDGLTDVYNDFHMGNAAEICAAGCDISREAQDEFAIESYKRATKAWSDGKFDNEIIPVEVPQRRGESIIVSEDEEYKKVNLEKIPTLRAVFQKDGTVTAANASTLNDGASALIICTKEKAEKLGMKPIGKIISYADAAQAPEWFTTAPSKALSIALKKAELNKTDVDFWELNQAFSVVGIANIKELGLNPEKVDVNGGAVSIGHPLGNSGSRIVVTLLNVLKQNGGKIGAAGICNGGGGASAIIIENVD